jgi:hypothetical protein
MRCSNKEDDTWMRPSCKAVYPGVHIPPCSRWRRRGEERVCRYRPSNSQRAWGPVSITVPRYLLLIGFRWRSYHGQASCPRQAWLDPSKPALVQPEPIVDESPRFMLEHAGTLLVTSSATILPSNFSFLLNGVDLYLICFALPRPDLDGSAPSFSLLCAPDLHLVPVSEASMGD